MSTCPMRQRIARQEAVEEARTSLASPSSAVSVSPGEIEFAGCRARPNSWRDERTRGRDPPSCHVGP